MLKYLKSILVILLIFTIISNFATVFAEENTEQKTTANRNEIIKFLDSLVDYDMWKQNWKDYLRGYCQRTQIFKIRERLSEARRDIINSVMAELNVNVDEMINEYYKLLAELYFIRNFVPSAENNSIMHGTEEGLLENPRAKLEKDLQDYLVADKGYLTAGKLSEYIDQFYKKYDKNSFINCFDPSIAGIERKWTSIKDKIQNINTDNILEDMELDEPIIYNATTLKDAPNTKTFLWNRIGLRLQNTEPLQDLQKIIENINEIKDSETEGTTKSTSLDNGDPSITEIFYSEEEDALRYEFEVESAKRLAIYETRYEGVSDSATARLTSLLQELNFTIENTSAPFEKIQTCVEKVVEKQCAK